MKDRIYNMLRNKSIFSRVHTINLIIAILPVLVVAIFSLCVFVSISMQRLSETETISLYNYTENLSSELYHLDNDVVSFAQSDSVQNLLKNYSTMSDYERYVAIDLVEKNYFQQFTMSDYITDAVLITNSYTVINICNGPHDDFAIQSLNYVELLHNTVNQTNKTLLSGTDKYKLDAGDSANSNGFLYSKRVVDNDTILNNAGYFVMYFDKAAFFNLSSEHNIGSANMTKHYIMDENASLLYTDDTTVKEETLSRIAKLMKANIAASDYSFRLSDRSYSLCVYYPIRGLDYYVVTVIPATVFMSQVRLIMILMAVLALLLIMFSWYFSAAIANSIYIPINNIHASLKAIEQNDFYVPPDDPYHDELASVRNLLNHTTSLIDKLIQQEKEDEKQKFELQFKSLQAQMNPHFLVNTLNSVIWLSDIQGANNIKELTQSLINILSTLLSNSSSYITFENEFKFLKDYVAIQQYRYFDQFAMEIDAADDLLQLKIPRFILQPIIENCIIHGLDDSVRFMTITLSVKVVEDFVRIQICDDGAGIPPQRLERILRFEESETAGTSSLRGLASIGLNNIQHRIQLIYGKNYGLAITSEVNLGTKVTVTFPNTYKEEAK